MTLSLQEMSSQLCGQKRQIHELESALQIAQEEYNEAQELLQYTEKERNVSLIHCTLCIIYHLHVHVLDTVLSMCYVDVAGCWLTAYLYMYVIIQEAQWVERETEEKFCDLQDENQKLNEKVLAFSYTIQVQNIVYMYM